MILHLTCACGRKFRVESRFAGRKAKCPQCGNAIVVPSSSPPSGSNSGHAPPASKTGLDEEDILKWLGPADPLPTTDEFGTPNVSLLPQDAMPDVPGLNEDAPDWLPSLQNVEDQPFESSSISPIGRLPVSSYSHAAPSRPRVSWLWGRIVSTENIGQRIAAGIILLIVLVIAGNMIARSGGLRALLPPLTDGAIAKRAQTEKDFNVAGEALENLGMEIYYASTGEVEWYNGRKVRDSRQRRRILVLSGDQINDDALIHLVTFNQGLQEFGAHNLEVVILSDSAISDAGIPHLLKLTGMQELRVANTKMSEQGIATLRETLGKHGIVVQQTLGKHGTVPQQ